MMVRTSLSIHHDSSVPQPKVFVPHTYDSKMQFLHSRHPKEKVVLERWKRVRTGALKSNQYSSQALEILLSSTRICFSLSESYIWMIDCRVTTKERMKRKSGRYQLTSKETMMGDLFCLFVFFCFSQILLLFVLQNRWYTYHYHYIPVLKVLSLKFENLKLRIKIIWSTNIFHLLVGTIVTRLFHMLICLPELWLSSGQAKFELSPYRLSIL